MSRKKQLLQAKRQMQEKAHEREQARLRHLAQAERPEGGIDWEKRNELQQEWNTKHADDSVYLGKVIGPNQCKDVQDYDLYATYRSQNNGRHRRKKRGVVWTEEGQSYTPTSKDTCIAIDPTISSEGVLSTVSRSISRWEMKGAQASIKRGALVMVVSEEYEHQTKACVTVMCDGRVFAGVPLKALRPMSEA